MDATSLLTRAVASAKLWSKAHFDIRLKAILQQMGFNNGCQHIEIIDLDTATSYGDYAMFAQIRNLATDGFDRQS